MDHHHAHGVDMGEQQMHSEHEGHNPAMFRRKFWLTAVLTIPVLLYSTTIQDLFNFKMTAFPGSAWVTVVLGSIIFFYGGFVFLKGAQRELHDRSPGMMTLISLAITVAFAYSLVVSFKLIAGMDFWWELTTLITIMLLGHWLEMKSVVKAEGALNELAKLMPDEAELVQEDGTTQVIRAVDLLVGEVVLVRPGANIPADGEVISGKSEVNEAMLTGESKPVKKKMHALVWGGTSNIDGALNVKITKVGNDTALAGIIKLVADASRSKSRTQVVADRAAFWLTIVAIFAAIATALGWSLFSDRSAAFILERVVTVLVIACPHALGLAVPLVAAISTTLAAQNGLLIRKRSALENARNIDVILFDKTGTLTTGKQSVQDIVSVDGKPDEILRLAAGAEFASEHPIARAIVAHAQKLKLPEATDFTDLKGRGVLATVHGKKIYVGGPSLLEKQKIDVPKSLHADLEKFRKEGKTIIYVARESKLLGVLTITDAIRPESKQAVQSLLSVGKRVAMLTGDAKNVAAWVAKELNISEYYAEILPKNKQDVVKKLQAAKTIVAVVGDGVNDAPALTQANIGIAIGAGTDVAIEAADIVLTGNDPRSVAKVITLSRLTYSKMVQNLLWAIVYNAVTIPLAAGAMAGFGIILSPALGAILMSLSTVIVAVNAQFLRSENL